MSNVITVVVIADLSYSNTQTYIHTYIHAYIHTYIHINFIYPKDLSSNSRMCDKSQCTTHKNSKHAQHKQYKYNMKRVNISENIRLLQVIYNFYMIYIYIYILVIKVILIMQGKVNSIIQVNNSI